MSTTRKELKQESKNQLRGNWLWAILVSFIAWLICYAINDIINFFEHGEDFVYGVVRRFGNHGELLYLAKVRANPFSGLITLILSIVMGLIMWGVAYTILHFRDNGKKANIFSGIFSAFSSNFENNFLIYILTEIFLLLWTWLFVIPGLIKGYSYSMTAYIMRDMLDNGHNPSATEAITESRKLMDGHKTELFFSRDLLI